MALVVGPIVDQLLRRVRDPAGAANARGFVQELLWRSQQAINGALNAIIETKAILVAGRQRFISITGSLPEALRVLSMRCGAFQGDVDPMPFYMLGQINRQWLRQYADGHLSVSLVGHDLLALYPGVTRDTTETFVYTKATGEITGDQDVMELPAEYVDVTMDLTEGLLLLKMREFELLKPLLDRIQKRLEYGQRLLHR